MSNPFSRLFGLGDKDQPIEKEEPINKEEIEIAAEVDVEERD